MDIWDHERSEPVSSFSWGADTVTALRFNPAEPDVLASAGSDRSVALYDLRSSTPIRKIIMQARHESHFKEKERAGFSRGSASQTGVGSSRDQPLPRRQSVLCMCSL